MAVGLLILRAVVGLTLAAHGAQKLFGWFGGYGLEGTGGFFEKLGFRPGRLHAFNAGLAGLIAVMVVAVLSVHVKNGFFATKNGYEYNLLIAAAALSLALTGPGRYSLDAALGLSLAGWAWGLGALALGVLGAMGNLALRGAEAAVAHSS